jgi:hypothetical protein
MGKNQERPPKAYKNAAFLQSEDARLIRILSEYLEPASRLKRERVQDTIVFFGSARILPREESEKRLLNMRRRLEEEGGGEKPSDAEMRLAERAVVLSRYYEDASTLAQMIVRWAKTLNGAHKRLMICSGGGPGIMEAANRGALQAGGQSIGLSISLPMEQRINPYVPKELAFEFHYFFMRKFWFVYPALALVIFPGGFGTLDEAFEVLTLVQTRKHPRPLPVLIYGSEYWRQVLNFDTLVQWGTIAPRDLDLFHYADDPQEAFDYLKDTLTRIHNL